MKKIKELEELEKKHNKIKNNKKKEQNIVQK